MQLNNLQVKHPVSLKRTAKRIKQSCPIVKITKYKK